MPEQPEAVRKPVLIAVLLVVLALAGSAAYYFVHHRAAKEAAIQEPEVAEPAPSQNPPDATSHTVAPVASQITPPAPTPAPPPQPTYADKIVSALVQLNMTNGPLTQEKLAAWQSTLQQLTNAGAGAIPAIRQFLASKQDMRFDSVGGSAALGQASLRLSMIDALSKIGGPDALATTGEALRSASDPREIAILARNLEQQAPGEYKQAAVEAARAALADAMAGKLSNVDVAGLFSVLQQYGGTDSALDLQNATGRYTYYSAIALAGLPEEAGLAALTQMAQETSASSRSTRAAALQGLAQMAVDSPTAREAFLQQAQNGPVATATWMKIASVLGGEQLQLGGGGDTGIIDSQDPKKATYHLTGGNQNFYTISVLDKLSADQINQRVQLVDQLLSANRDPAATEALQRARTQLTTRAQPRP